jgi:hypothetical protein
VVVGFAGDCLFLAASLAIGDLLEGFFSSMSKPGFFLYTGDLIKDTNCLTLDAFGAWVKLLCVLTETQGTITQSFETYAHFWSVSNEVARGIIHQLEVTGVADVEYIFACGYPVDNPVDNSVDNFSDNVKMAKMANAWQNMAKISNRRIVRNAQKKERIRQIRREAGKKGAWQRWQPSLIDKIYNKNQRKNKEIKSRAAEKEPEGKEQASAKIQEMIKTLAADKSPK